VNSICLPEKFVTANVYLEDAMRKFLLLAGFSVFALSFSACAQTVVEDEPVELSKAEESASAMSSDRMGEIIQKFDEDATIEDNRITFKVRERDLLIVFDNNADRMRIVTPIIQAAAVPESVHERMLQANFDAVLDSRYAIANELVWAVFIHRLSTLNEDDLMSGIAQTYAAAQTFGSAYTSGVIVFGGGDSNSLHEELLEELENKPKKEDQGI